MARQLKEYGKEQEIVIRDPWTSKTVRVFAFAEDSETPYVIIRQYDYNGTITGEIWMEDYTSNLVMKKIQAALNILPTSK